MKIFKKILVLIAILIALPFIVALFLKKDYKVQKSITVNKPKQEVFDYIKHLKNMDHYSPWAKIDPNMKKSYRGTDGTEGFVSAWSSTNKDVGVGEQEIEKIVEGESIDFKLRFFEPFKANDHGYLLTNAISANQTKVTWGFDGHMDYPANILIPLMKFEKMIGDDFAKGLNNLKHLLEN